MKRILAFGLCLVFLVTACSLGGCAYTVRAEDLMDGVNPRQTTGRQTDDTFRRGYADFALSLLRNVGKEGENALVSPLSVMLALSMTANGAKGKTAEELNALLGNFSAEERNRYLLTFCENLKKSDKAKCLTANSLWIRDGVLTVEKDFLQTNADYYGAAVYRAPFDRNTLRDINAWVKKKTDGMIPKTLDSIDQGTAMYLVNALLFEAEWQTIYESTAVRDGDFTTPSGKKERVKMMYADEGVYLEDAHVTGFTKAYKDGYRFMALLPKEGMTAGEYLANLTAEDLLALLDGAQRGCTVRTAIPKFSHSCSAELSDILKNMGAATAFDAQTADFSGIGRVGDENLFIGKVVHKTAIRVDERGTKAGAVTSVAVDCTSADAIKSYSVFLNRPFLYAILDEQTGLPLFIGTVCSVNP